MAKNLGREFATMDDDERKRFAGEPLRPEEEDEGRPDELKLGEPRDEDHMGRQYASLDDEVADPEHRDGMGALLDDEQHERRVQERSRSKSARPRRKGGGR